MKLGELSSNLTHIITKDLKYNEDQKEIITYAIETTLHAFFGTLLMVLVAYVFGVIKPVLIAALFGFLLRKLSGGAHFSTPMRCSVFGAIIYTGVGFLAQRIMEFSLSYEYLLWPCLALSLFIVIILAPVDSENKPIHSITLRKKLKALSIAFVIASILIGIVSTNSLLNVSMSLGILYQSLTLLPIFNRRGGG